MTRGGRERGGENGPPGVKRGERSGVENGWATGRDRPGTLMFFVRSPLPILSVLFSKSLRTES